MFNRNRILVTGGKGMLGSEFCRIFETGNKVFLPIDLPEVDITKRKQVRKAILEFAPDLLIHCAAYTQVDQAEAEPETVFTVNALATRWIAQTCAEIEARLVYFSTDYVFCDSPGANPRTEFDPPAPRGVYARSKFAGEVEVRNHQPHHFIIRTSWLYGRSGKNFVDTILQAAREKPALKVVSDQVGSPTYAPDLAKETLRLVDSGPCGTYHITGNGNCSWFRFAREILKYAGLKRRIYPVSTQEYGAAAPRPGYSVLDHLALRNTIGDKMPHWKDSLKRYIDDKRSRGELP